MCKPSAKAIVTCCLYILCVCLYVSSGLLNMETQPATIDESEITQKDMDDKGKVDVDLGDSNEIRQEETNIGRRKEVMVGNLGYDVLWELYSERRLALISQWMSICKILGYH